LIDAGNKEQLKEAIIKLTASQELRQQLGYNAWQTIKNNYSPEIQLAKLAKLFNEI
jgi:glycosyltransferase involved in cell wall biosynthesis